MSFVFFSSDNGKIIFHNAQLNFKKNGDLRFQWSGVQMSSWFKGPKKSISHLDQRWSKKLLWLSKHHFALNQSCLPTEIVLSQVLKLNKNIYQQSIKRLQTWENFETMLFTFPVVLNMLAREFERHSKPSTLACFSIRNNSIHSNVLCNN